MTNTTQRIFTPNTFSVGASYSNFWQASKITDYSIADNTITVTVSSGYGVGFALKVKPETYYTVSATRTGDSPRINNAFYDSQGNYLGSSSTGPHITTFETPADTDIMVIIFTSLNNSTATYTNVQVEEGQTATSYEPYENICPISGWTDLEVTKCRKNLFNKNDVESGYISAVTTSTRQLGEIIPSNNWRTSNYILVAPLTTYTLSMPNQTNASVAGLVMYSDKKVGKEINGFSLETMKISTNYYYTFTTPSNCYYIKFAMSANYIDAIQLELGSTATEYETYNSETIPVVFPITKNLFDEVYEGISGTLIYRSIYVGDNTVTASTTTPRYYTEAMPTGYSNLFILAGQVTSGAGTGTNDIWTGTIRTVTPIDGYITIAYRNNSGVDPRNYHTQIEFGSTATAYEPYGTIYGGYVDLVSGEIVQEYELVADTWGNIKYSSINSTTGYQYGRLFFNNPVIKAGMSDASKVSYCNVGKYTWNLNANATPHFYIDTISNTERYTAYVTLSSTTDDNLLITCAGKLINPIHYTLSPTQLKTLRGINNIWSNSNGDITVQFWRH